LLLILFFFFLLFLWGQSLQKSLKLCHFKLHWNEIWQDCSSSKYALTYRFRFPTWHQNFEMAAMTSLCEKAKALVFKSDWDEI